MIFFAEQFTGQHQKQNLLIERFRTRLAKALTLLACVFMLGLNSAVLLADDYVVVKGDTLSKIALRVYGDAGLWNEICKANSFNLCDQLEVGQRIVLPSAFENKGYNHNKGEILSDKPHRSVEARTNVIATTTSLPRLEQQIRDRIVAVRPDLVVEGLTTTPINGLYEATIKDGPKIYVTNDGGFFITGDMYAVKAEGIVNLAEVVRQQERMVSLAAISDDDMIIFSPKKTKAIVTVFTDVDCGYCQKLHKEVPELNRLGVEVRYLAFPRAGVGSETYHKLVSAWCADDPKEALTALKNRQSIDNKSCDNPIAEQYALGQTMGVTGTPALITSDGRLLPGYMPANVLAETLGITTD